MKTEYRVVLSQRPIYKNHFKRFPRCTPTITMLFATISILWPFLHPSRQDNPRHALQPPERHHARSQATRRSRSDQANLCIGVLAGVSRAQKCRIHSNPITFLSHSTLTSYGRQVRVRGSTLGVGGGPFWSPSRPYGRCRPAFKKMRP